MTEQELFEAIGRLSEQYRTEALTPEKAQPADRQPNEIDALFDSAGHTEAVQYRTAPGQKTAGGTAEPIRRSVRQEHPKSGIIGLTAIAAAVALTVGVFAWKMRQDAGIADTPAAMPGTSAGSDYVQESDIAAETVTVQPGDSMQPDDSAQQSSSGSLTDEPDVQPEDSANIFGGHGAIKPVVYSNAADTILEDDDYWYMNGSYRISKAKLNESGHLYSELVCQTAGCAHKDASCPFYNYLYKLITDGTYVYHTYNNEHIPYTHIEMLDEHGQWGDLFSLHEHAAICDALTEQYHTLPGANPDLVVTSSSDVSFYHVLRLGDSFRYYIGGMVDFSQTDRQSKSFFFGILIDTADDSFAILPYSANLPAYDEESGLLYLLDVVNQEIDTAENWAYIYDLNQIELSFAPQGSMPKPFEIIMTGTVSEWSLLDGKLYYFANEETEDLHVVKHYDLLCYDPENGERTVLEKDTEKQNLSAAEGRLYYRIHTRVGKDKICSCAPDLSDEQVIYETPNEIRWFCQVCDPSFIWFDGTMGYNFILNGEVMRVEIQA